MYADVGFFSQKSAWASNSSCSDVAAYPKDIVVEQGIKEIADDKNGREEGLNVEVSKSLERLTFLSPY